jgi:hypothetical protein
MNMRMAHLEEGRARTVFVGNVPVGIKRKTIKEIFRSNFSSIFLFKNYFFCSPFGKLEKVYQRTLLQKTEKLTKQVLAKDKQNELGGRLTSTNFFVRFSQETEAEKAVKQLCVFAGERWHKIAQKMPNLGRAPDWRGTHFASLWATNTSVTTNGGCVLFLPFNLQFLTSVPFSSIFIGNLPFSTTEEQARAQFRQFGPVSSVRLLHNKENGQNRGCGYVEFAQKYRNSALTDQFQGIRGQSPWNGWPGIHGTKTASGQSVQEEEGRNSQPSGQNNGQCIQRQRQKFSLGRHSKKSGKVCDETYGNS